MYAKCKTVKTFVLTGSLSLLLITSTLGTLISFFFGIKAYQFVSIIVFIIAVFFLAASMVNTEKKKAKVSVPFFSSLILYAFGTMYGFHSGAIQLSLIAAGKGVSIYLIYAFPVLLLLLTPTITKHIHTSLLVELNTLLAVFIGFFALYQYYHDPLLMGMYSGTYYESFDQLKIPRSSSILSSPQVFSAYMIFSLLYVSMLHPFKSELLNLTCFTWIFFTGFLSGSQLYFFLSFIVLAQYFSNGLGVSRKSKILSLVIMFVVLVVLSMVYDIFDTPAFNRVASLIYGGLDGAFYKINFSRFEIWSDVIKESNIFYGNGIGSANLVVSGSDRYNTESYFLNLYYEGGVFFLITILLSLSLICFHSKKNIGVLNSIVVLFVVIAYGFSVHVYFSILLYSVWLLLLVINVPKKIKNEDFAKSDNAISA